MVNGTLPLRIGAVLFPAITALDLFGPLNALNVLSIQHPMTLSLISTDMNPVTVDRTFINGAYMGMPSASPDFTQRVLPTHTFDDAPEFDVLLIAGGAGTRNMNVTQPHVDFIRERFDDPALDYVLTVCTGTALLARTGKIAGRNATTNKAAYNWVKTVPHAADVNWVPRARWVVDGNLWTSSGVSAGTDMALGWIEHVYGRSESERIRVLMEWNSLNQTDDPFADIYGLV
jgi:putative intracellular protease/amidase